MTATLSFLGAARNVTGSRYLLETDAARVLVDCGLYQERALRNRNHEKFHCDPSTIDAVVLTHGHLDHCGLLPKLYKEGFRGRIICTDVTAEVATIVWHDAASLQLLDIRNKKRRHQRQGRTSPHPLEPLYLEEHVKECEKLFDPVAYGQSVAVAEGVDAVFRDVGHILGSAMVKLTVADGTTSRTIVFSGDIGSWDKPILRDPATCELADYVVMESTYGDRVHEDRVSTADQLEKVINETVHRGGNILIPSFAIERSQEVLYHLHLLRKEKRIPRLMVILDSPMAIRVTEVFKKHEHLFDAEMRALLEDGAGPFSFTGLKMSRTTDDSKSINNIKGSAIIIAGSGMCTGGRIKHHLVHNIERPESAVLFVGYQANGTLGRLLVEGVDPVRILGEKRDVNARIVQIHGFSGHADQNELLRWASSLKSAPKHAFVTHGGSGVSARFAQLLHDRFGWETSNPPYQHQAELT